MNIGVMYCGYNQIDNIKQSLNFWNELQIPGHKFNISVVSVPFVEYKDVDIKLDNSIDYIKNLKEVNIKSKIFEPTYVKESVARSYCLRDLLNLGVDLIWQVDSDEFYTVSDVENMCKFIEQNNHPTYSVNFKNYVFDGKHYIDKYCTVRIFRVYSNDRFLGFLDDCNIIYENKKLVKPLEIPKHLAWIKHMTWLHSNGKEKVEYQVKHFGYCSYKWNYLKNELELDMDYYKRFGEKIPNILKEE